MGIVFLKIRITSTPGRTNNPRKNYLDHFNLTFKQIQIINNNLTNKLSQNNALTKQINTVEFFITFSHPKQQFSLELNCSIYTKISPLFMNKYKH